jgi:hypothetical protein
VVGHLQLEQVRIDGGISSAEQSSKAALVDTSHPRRGFGAANSSAAETIDDPAVPGLAIGQLGQWGMNMRKNASRIGAGLLASLLMVLGYAGTADAARPLRTLTMDELAPQPADDLVVAGGVRFDFKINGEDSFDATYGSGGPGSTVFVQDPSLEGNTAGVLRVSFAQPTTVVRFGVALSASGPFEDAVTVQVYNPGGHLKTTLTLDTASPPESFTEAGFVYQGGAISSIAVSFRSGVADRFAFDNLTFRTPPHA